MTNSEIKRAASEPAAKASATSVTPPFAGEAVDEERIRMRAYELYCERGGDGGDAVGDWLRAEHEQAERRPDAVDAPASSGTPSLAGAR